MDSPARLHWNGARVLVLTDFLSSFGGTERYPATVCDTLAGAGVAVEVVCVEPLRDRTWAEELAARCTTVLAPETGEARDALWVEIGRRTAERPPDLVLVNPMGEALVQWLSRLPEGTPLPPVVGVEYSHPGPASAHWYPPTLKRSIKRVAAVITTCEASRTGVLQQFGYPGPVHVVPHLVQAPAAVSAPSLPRHHLGLVARLSVEKGIDFAIAAVALLRRAGTAVELSVYGAGADAERLGELASCLGIRSSVHLRGTFHPRSGLEDTVARHGVWLQPSLFESVPTSLLELLARGRTVVATDVGGVPEVLDGAPCGRDLLVPPADTAALADRVRDVLARPAHYDTITAGARDRVLARHAPDAVAPRLINILRRYARRSPVAAGGRPEGAGQ